MKAVVLAGGEGTRLRPLTYTTPKQMLPVGGAPMLERVLHHLAAHGVDEVVLSLGYRPGVFMEAYPDGMCAGVRLGYAVEDEPLGTAGAVRFAASSARVDETFVAVNGDVLTGLDVSSLVAFHRERGARATIALTPVEDPSRFGVVVTDPDGRVSDFVEKPPAGEAPSNLINAGTYVLEASVLETVPEGRAVSIEREIFPVLASQGSLYAIASNAWWIDAGTPEAYIEANLRYAVGPPASVRIEPEASVTASVLGSDVCVEAGAKVDSSVLFDGAWVGERATVRDSILGHRARVGPGASVTELSVLGDDVEVPAGASLRGRRVPLPA